MSSEQLAVRRRMSAMRGIKGCLLEAVLIATKGKIPQEDIDALWDVTNKICDEIEALEKTQAGLERQSEEGAEDDGDEGRQE